MNAPGADVLARRRLLLPLLVLVSMLGPLTLNILLPSLPGLVQTLAAPREQVQLALSLFLIGMAVSQLVLGPLADRFGRRPVLVGAILLYVGASLIVLVVPTIEGLIVARLLQAFGGTAGIALGRTVIRDLFRSERVASMISYVTMAMVLAPMVAPSLGAALDETFGWQALFVFSAGFGLVALAMTLLILPETRPASMQAATAGDILRLSAGLFRSRRFLGSAATVAFCSAVFFTLIGAAPYLVIDGMGVSKAGYALWFMLLAVGYMAGNFTSGRLSVHQSIDRLVALGNWLGVAATVLLLALAAMRVVHPAAIFVPGMLFSFGNGLVLPNAIAGGISVDPKAAGAASGLLGFAQMGVGAISSFAAGKLSALSSLPVAAVMAGFALLALAGGIYARERNAGEARS